MLWFALQTGLHMDSPVAGIRRIAFVTRRFHELEGLVPRRSFAAGARTRVAATVALACGSVLWSVNGRVAAMMLPVLSIALLLVSQVAIAIPDALRAVREMHRTGRVHGPTGPALDLRLGTLLLCFAVALAASIEAAIGARGLLAVVLALSIATSTKPRPGYRLRYASATLLLLAAVSGWNAGPVQGLAILLIAGSVAVLVEGFVDDRMGATDADTI